MRITEVINHLFVFIIFSSHFHEPFTYGASVVNPEFYRIHWLNPPLPTPKGNSILLQEKGNIDAYNESTFKSQLKKN